MERSGAVEKPIEHTHIGGQAVIEGVMMRGKRNWALAVRLAGGDIHVEEHDLKAPPEDSFWKWPILRGMRGLWTTLALAMKAFGISATLAGETEEEQLSKGEVALTIVLGIGLAVGLFIVLPAVATNLLGERVRESTLGWNLIDGVLRLVVFFAYIWAVSRIKDIARVFAYHGAEHKTIHAYEHGLPLRADVIQRYETLHVRCGTSFLLMVMVIAIVVFSLVPADTLVARVGVRIVLLPLIAGLAYEVIKWAGKNPNSGLVRVLLWPGLQLQRMTTSEPTDDMVEIAVAAMARVVRAETGEWPEGYEPPDVDADDRPESRSERAEGERRGAASASTDSDGIARDDDSMTDADDASGAGV
jgi:uncharacterized protein YqhQ